MCQSSTIANLGASSALLVFSVLILISSFVLAVALVQFTPYCNREVAHVVVC